MSEQEFPVAVTVSYTAMITASNKEHALRIANNMSAEEILEYISLNPSIEIEPIDDDTIE